MNTVLNNLISLATEGAFGNKREIIPMSKFKWGVLQEIAEYEDIIPFVSKGMERHGNDNPDTITPYGESYANVPLKTREKMQNSNFNNSDNLSHGMDISDIDSLKLTYVLKKYILKDIVDKERHSIDTSKTSLDFLALIIQNTDIILRYGIRLRGIIEIGLFLRNKGQYVDFVKVESWISKLKLKQMAALQASVIIKLFDFEKDEFPYIRKFEGKAISLATDSMEKVYKMNKRSRSFSKYSIRNCIKFYRYTRSEALCKALYITSRSLADIEE